MITPMPLSLAVCQDCHGAGLRLEHRAYLPTGSTRIRARLVPVGCRNCRGRGRYPATEATGGPGAGEPT
jgi:hypothetical protein